MRGILGVLMACALVFSTTSARSFDVTPLLVSGPTDTRFDVVILGDGYTANDQDLLVADAEWAIAIIFERMPLIRFRPLFNFSVVGVVSAESGVDGGAFGDERDTALGGGLGTQICGNSILCLDENEARRVAAEHVPAFQHVIVLFNDLGNGALSGSRDGGATKALRKTIPSMAHEMGHRWAGLGDEYDGSTDTLPVTPAGGAVGWDWRAPCDPVLDCPEPNLTVRPDEPRWIHWIADPKNIVTSGQLPLDQAGMFAGGRHGQEGIHRPWLDCKMRDAERPFCPVCREQINLSLWHLSDVSMIEFASPEPDELLLSDGVVSFEVQPMAVSPSFWEYSWSVDGAEFVPGESSLALTLPPGEHLVVARVRDATPDVRSDPDGLMTDEVSWTVTVEAPAVDAGPGDAGSDVVDAGEITEVDSGAEPKVDSGAATRADSGVADKPEQDAAVPPVPALDAGTAAAPVLDSGGAEQPDSGVVATVAQDSGVAPVSDSGPAQEYSNDAAPETATAPSDGGCSCRTQQGSVAWWCLVAVLGLVRRRM